MSTVESEPADEPCPETRRTRTQTKADTRRRAQDAALAERIAALDNGKTPRLLDALEHEFAPLRAGREPFWAPELPGITYAVYTYGYTWSRAYDGPVVVLDRSGAWMSAASSVDVAHGALVHTGPIEFAGAPGYYKLTVYPWTEADLPHPLGTTTRDEVWVTQPTVQLLANLVDAGRWPDVAILDSYTSDQKCRLTEWVTLTNHLREYAITRYGRDSDQYGTVKDNFSQALTLMVGKQDDGVRRTWRCRCRRPDWYQSVDALCGATLWRWADDLRDIASPVALRAKDELVIPADRLEAATTTRRSRDRAPLLLDPTGIKLGSFKVKEQANA